MVGFPSGIKLTSLPFDSTRWGPKGPKVAKLVQITHDLFTLYLYIYIYVG